MPRTAGNDSSPVYVLNFAVTGVAAGVIKAIENSNNSGPGARCWVHRAWLNRATPSTGAATADLGMGDSSTDTADSRSDDLLDGIDLNAAAGMSDSIALDIAGATGFAGPVEWPLDDFILLHVKTGDASGFVGELCIQYSYA